MFLMISLKYMVSDTRYLTGHIAFKRLYLIKGVSYDFFRNALFYDLYIGHIKVT